MLRLSRIHIMNFLNQKQKRGRAIARSHSSLKLNLTLILVLALAGCGENKVAQCNLLIEQVNAAEQTLGNITQSSPPDINALQDIANATSKAQQDLDAIDLKGKKLNKFQEDFSSFYSDISTDAQAIVNAHESQNMREAEEAYQRLEATFATQDMLVQDINTFCSDSYEE